MKNRYDPKAFEKKWQLLWQESNLFKTREDAERKKYYLLDFFPYPSGAGLSVGHCRNYIPSDVLGRMKYMQGYNVLHPMGFDSFGLPAENEAIAKKTHPAPMIKKYADNYRRQMDLIGIAFDWSRSFSSCDSEYYRWTQWIFKRLAEQGLVYQKMAAVNWDPVEKTVLADEEVIGGRGWRSGALVEQKDIPQWFFKITAYAERLLEDLNDLDWPEGIKQQQRNWIGKSEGIQLSFKIQGHPDLEFEVFTTRVDTQFGVSFCVLSPEHPLVDNLLEHVDKKYSEDVKKYREDIKSKSDEDRLAATKEKTGVFLGSYAINPINSERVPIWIADYVLMNYGTGAVMGVPGHDERDYYFAQKYGIDIPIVISSKQGEFSAQPYFDKKEGYLIHSGSFDGLTIQEGIKKISEWFEEHQIGQRKTQYKLRDWLISRQRYWGCPIPVLYDEEGGVHFVEDKDLPVLLPEIEHYEPSTDGSSPLSRIPDFVDVVIEGKKYRRETDTMSGFACSSWYFLRFTDPHNLDQPWSDSKVKYWMPVDCYVGGAEHAVMHLLYARFWNKVLYDLCLVPHKEPFQSLHNQGMLLAKTPFRKPHVGETLHVGEEGIQISFEEAKALPKEEVFYRWEKMSKSKGNVVTPDEAVDQYGADALRVFELFVAPFEQSLQWSEEGIQGTVRFLHRVFNFVNQMKDQYDSEWRAKIDLMKMTPLGKQVRKHIHQGIFKATQDIERFAFNTYISAMMILLNQLTDALQSSGEVLDDFSKMAFSEAVEYFILLLSPAAPHCADELWSSLGQRGFTYHMDWPVGCPDLAAEDTITIAVQVNGKLRDTLEVPAEASKEELEKVAQESEKIKRFIHGKTIQKVIVVPGKLVNIVVS